MALSKVGTIRGPDGINAYSRSVAPFSVPDLGQTVSVALEDASWIVNGQTVWVSQAGSGGEAGALVVTARLGDTVTLLNPEPTGKGATGATGPTGDTGAIGDTGPTGPPGPIVVSTNPGNYARLGSDELIYVPTGNFRSLSGETTLLPDWRGSYLICSGGEWTLHLPSPDLTLTYFIRNDMGLVAPTGPITIQPASGMIDGAASLLLLPGQECRLFTDGVNWRSFGRQREVVIGTIDVTNAANVDIQLPGYRSYDVVIEDYKQSAIGQVSALISLDGGATWNAATTYNRGALVNNTATTAAYVYASGSAPYIGYSDVNASGSGVLWLFPGAGLLNYTQGWINARGNYCVLGQTTVSNFNAVRLIPTGTFNVFRATVIGRC